MRVTSLLFRFSLCCSLAYSGTAFSTEDHLSPNVTDADVGYDYIIEKKWQEEGVVIPPFPAESDLLRTEVDNPIQRYTYYVDAKSLSPGKDGVIRYTVAIESPSGVRNIMFEGIRCINREYRTYAYGTSDGKFAEASVSNWQYIQEKVGLPHRYEFHKNYLCSPYGEPLPVDKILDRIKYPESFTTYHGERDD